jgi:hypothetical protein
MYLSRLAFHSLPGRTEKVQNKLAMLAKWVAEAGGTNPRIMRTHYGSLGAPDLLFEQEVQDPAMLEEQIKAVTARQEFQQWSQQVAALLEQSSKRELFKVIDSIQS